MPDNGAGGRSFEGYLRLTSSAGVAAWQMVETPLVRGILGGVPLAQTDSVVMAPYFVFGGAYRSTLNLINPTDESVIIQLIAEDGSGRSIGESVEQTLAPGSGIRSGIQELFEIVTVQTFPRPLVTGYVRVKESQNQPLSLIGSVEIVSIGQGTFQQSAMSYPFGPSASGTWIIPLALGGSTYYSGFAIANLNESLAVQTDVTVEVVQSNGTVIDTEEVSLSPRDRYTAVVPNGLDSGYIRITANMLVRVLGAIGTKDLRLLEQIPALTR